MDKSDLIERYFDLSEIMGTEQLLTAVLFALGTDELQSTFEYICRCYEIEFSEEEEDDEEYDY